MWGGALSLQPWGAPSLHERPPVGRAHRARGPVLEKDHLCHPVAVAWVARRVRPHAGLELPIGGQGRITPPPKKRVRFIAHVAVGQALWMSISPFVKCGQNWDTRPWCPSWMTRVRGFARALAWATRDVSCLDSWLPAMGRGCLPCVARAQGHEAENPRGFLAGWWNPVLCTVRILFHNIVAAEASPQRDRRPASGRSGTGLPLCFKSGEPH